MHQSSIGNVWQHCGCVGSILLASSFGWLHLVPASPLVWSTAAHSGPGQQLLTSGTRLGLLELHSTTRCSFPDVTSFSGSAGSGGTHRVHLDSPHPPSLPAPHPSHIGQQSEWGCNGVAHQPCSARRGPRRLLAQPQALQCRHHKGQGPAGGCWPPSRPDGGRTSMLPLNLPTGALGES